MIDICAVSRLMAPSERSDRLHELGLLDLRPVDHRWAAERGLRIGPASRELGARLCESYVAWAGLCRRVPWLERELKSYWRCGADESRVIEPEEAHLLLASAKLQRAELDPALDSDAVAVLDLLIEGLELAADGGAMWLY